MSGSALERTRPIWPELKDELNEFAVRGRRVFPIEVKFAADLSDRLRDAKRARRAQSEEQTVTMRRSVQVVVARLARRQWAALNAPRDPMADYVLSLVKTAVYAVFSVLCLILVVGLITRGAYAYVFPAGLAAVGCAVLALITLAIHFRKHRLMVKGWPRA